MVPGPIPFNASVLSPVQPLQPWIFTVCLKFYVGKFVIWTISMMSIYWNILILFDVFSHTRENLKLLFV